jgi:YHS domain-containing protein
MRKKLMLLLLSLALSACVPMWHTFNDEEFETVIRVELINYDNPDAKIIKRNNDIILSPFGFDKVEIIATLPEERNDAFLKEFASKSLYYSEKHLDSPQGISLRLICKNGDFMIVSRGRDINSGYSAWFDSYGNVTYFFGSGFDYRTFRDWASRYFDTQL